MEFLRCFRFSGKVPFSSGYTRGPDLCRLAGQEESYKELHDRQGEMCTPCAEEWTFATAILDLGFGDGEQAYGPPSGVAPARVQTNLTSNTDFLPTDTCLS